MLQQPSSHLPPRSHRIYAAMDDAEGRLCATCISTFAKGDGILHKHHQLYSDLVASKDASCFICTWIWSRYHSQQTNKNNAGDGGYFKVTCDMKIGFCGECFATFHIQSSRPSPYDISGTS